MAAAQAWMPSPKATVTCASVPGLAEPVTTPRSHGHVATFHFPLAPHDTFARSPRRDVGHEKSARQPRLVQTLAPSPLAVQPKEKPGRHGVLLSWVSTCTLAVQLPERVSAVRGDPCSRRLLT